METAYRRHRSSAETFSDVIAKLIVLFLVWWGLLVLLSKLV
jgi:hypothetical protein